MGSKYTVWGWGPDPKDPRFRCQQELYAGENFVTALRAARTAHRSGKYGCFSWEPRDFEVDEMK